MLWKYLAVSAVVTFIGTVFVTFSVFFLMMAEVIVFGPPPVWLAYGFLSGLFFTACSAVSYGIHYLLGGDQ